MIRSKENLLLAYKQIKIGNPLDTNNHMGPLIDVDAVNTYLNAIKAVKEQGGTILLEGSQLTIEGSNCYVSPSIAEVKNEMAIVQHETFAPILYLLKYDRP
jgi:aldehyde dehydrogenase (NAD+)